MAIRQRVTISVPPDLRARMEAEGDGINWSAEACRAFEQALAAKATQPGEVNMQNVIERLKASKEKLYQDAQEAGRVEGREWAMHKAEYFQLYHLSIHRDACEREANIDLESAIKDPKLNDESPAVRLFYGFTPAAESEGDREAAYRFWAETTGNDDPGPRFTYGFALGALEVWDQVSEQVGPIED